ncbi:Heterokaryon incompatibility protein (HET) domain containing protein [Hyaloscypha variabilis]
MRLVNSTTLELKEFLDNDIPPYAILSHTWGAEEISYQDACDTKSSGRRKKGFAKIRGCCAQARMVELEWVWIDTCCIDKTSSAELSEAINSMYKWYEKADICYAYLEDVPTSLSEFSINLLLTARWFTRGWTLQELVAPRIVEFYARDWTEIGTKFSLCSLLSKRTGMDEALLLCQKPPSMYPISQCMSWASQRETTRVEDGAYCLFGLFGVNMPLLYGEGSRAFGRLQEEILRRYEDYSIFLWTSNIKNPTFLARYALSFRDEKPISLQQEPLRWSDMTTCPPSMLKHCVARQDPRFSWVTPDAASMINDARFEPPSITSRGLRITLLVTSQIPNILLLGTTLAWTFCLHKAAAQTRLICIRYAEAEGTLLRQRTRLLDCIDPKDLAAFHPQELYLPLDSNFGQDYIALQPGSGQNWRELCVTIIKPLRVDDVYTLESESDLLGRDYIRQRTSKVAMSWNRDFMYGFDFAVIRVHIMLNKKLCYVPICVGKEDGVRYVCDLQLSDKVDVSVEEFRALKKEFKSRDARLTDRAQLTLENGKSLFNSLRPLSKKMRVEVRGSGFGDEEEIGEDEMEMDSAHLEIRPPAPPSL